MTYKNEDCWNGQDYSLETVTKNSIKKFKKVMSLMPGQGSVLDVGCGNGAFHEFLRDAGYKDVTGIDFTEHLIETAKFNNPDIKYIIHDACKKFPLKKKFDIVISVELLEHVPSPYLVMENMFEICKEGGCCIISTPNAMWREFKHMRNKNWDFPKNVFQYLTPGVIAGMARDIGGTVTYISPVYRYEHIYLRFEKRKNDGHS